MIASGRCSNCKFLRAAVISVALLLSACAAPPIDRIDLMPAPDVFADGLLDPLPEAHPFESIPYGGILYATDRMPATPEDEENFYLNDRGHVLRVGVGRMALGETDIDWQQARDISLLKSRPRNYPIKLQDIEEWGLLEDTLPFWVNLDLVPEHIGTDDATDRFAAAIDAQMQQSGRRHVYIYAHGYRVVFENPLLVSTELWHFLGYQGAFIAYAWPSTPSRWAYLKDSDTSDGFARNFRLLIETIAKNTEVEQIHLIGYSNGTRLVTRALEQLAIARQHQTAAENFAELKIQNVILLGSDLDRGAFGSYVADGMLDIAKHMTIYLSKHDKALGFSQLVSRRQRVGQLWGSGPDEIPPQARSAMERYRDRISYVNVSDAEGADAGNGHQYFRASPWASSDVLMSLYYGLSPAERGLVEQEDLPVFTFPPDYIARLWAAIERVNPDFAAAYRKLRATTDTGSNR